VYLVGDVMLASRAVAAVIARVWTDDIRLVVSSDLSHFESYHTAHRHDERTAMTIEPLDAGAIGPSDACGHLAIQDTLREARVSPFCNSESAC
jgi:AmmeMemoRadiSam system protein B